MLCVKEKSAESSTNLLFFREALQTRAVEYQNELEQIKEKLRKQPTLLERQEMLVKRHSLEKKYHETLKAAGVKSIPTRTKISKQASYEPSSPPPRKISDQSITSSAKIAKAGDESRKSSKSSTSSSKSSDKSDSNTPQPQKRDEEISGADTKTYREEVFEVRV